MSSLNGRRGLDLGCLLKPPKSSLVHVRCLQDVGTIITSEGHKVVLRKNSQHLLPIIDVEAMIRIGLLEHLE
ncbi:hypothetical protein GJ496_009716 [Pomphorhynchus laevis]|nr:hypothetical protein GJ496_000076 [Pomphorhynchus laevis]KAI0989573.1 hypothetical protein GJ496_009716 [Pomphorhynchus laevis]